MHIAKCGFRRLRIALAESRLLYCDYEGPRAMSGTEFSDLGITWHEIPMLVSNEARAAVARTASTVVSRVCVPSWRQADLREPSR